MNSPKFKYKILHNPGPVEGHSTSYEIVEHRSRHYISGVCIKMRRGERLEIIGDSSSSVIVV
jgi:hypothetical protein